MFHGFGNLVIWLWKSFGNIVKGVCMHPDLGALPRASPPDDNEVLHSKIHTSPLYSLMLRADMKNSHHGISQQFVHQQKVLVKFFKNIQ